MPYGVGCSFDWWGSTHCAAPTSVLLGQCEEQRRPWLQVLLINTECILVCALLPAQIQNPVPYQWKLILYQPKQTHFSSQQSYHSVTPISDFSFLSVKLFCVTFPHFFFWTCLYHLYLTSVVLKYLTSFLSSQNKTWLVQKPWWLQYYLQLEIFHRTPALLYVTLATLEDLKTLK